MRNRKHIYSVLRLIGCIALAAALALSCIGCGSKPKTETVSAGEAKAFTVEVTDLEGAVTTFDYSSEKATVGEALLEKGLIEGTDSEYGLYVTTVNGIPLDWNKDQKYWAFYVNGEYAIAGVDQTELTEGAVYGFKPEG